MDECVPERFHIPGFTGHCPGLRFVSGKPFGKLTAELLSQRKKQQESDTSAQPANIPQDVSTKEAVSQRTIPRMFDNYKPVHSLPEGRPYSMDDDNPLKYFISGYTGHVPLSHNMFGKSSAITTNQALIEYGRQQRRLESNDHDTTPQPISYSPHKGVVPGYTGHIPGQCLQHTSHNSILRPPASYAKETYK